MTMRTLWLRWVLANALGELVGLGATFGVGALFFLSAGEPRGASMVLLAFGVAVLSGAIEATVVGLAQWWAMRPAFPMVSRRAWWLATLIGALLAYVLGYLPSTLMDLAQPAADPATMSEPPQWMVLLLAAGMGALGGAVLSFAQWRVLRHSVPGAGLWIPANMLAWAAGMPIIFWGIDAAQAGPSLWAGILLVTLALLICGLVVGAIHGLALVRLARRAAEAAPPPLPA